MFKDSLAYQVFTFRPHQKMLQMKTSVDTNWQDTFWSRKPENWRFASTIQTRRVKQTWLFFLRRILEPSCVSNSPWSTKHRTCVQNNNTNLDKCFLFQKQQNGAREEEKNFQWRSSPQCTEISAALCPGSGPIHRTRQSISCTWPNSCCICWTIESATRNKFWTNESWRNLRVTTHAFLLTLTHDVRFIRP